MKKKKISINFKYLYEGFNPEDNFFTNFLREDYEVIISEKPNFLFYSIYPEVDNTKKDLSKKGDLIKRISPRLYVLIRKLYSKIMNSSKKENLTLPEGDYVKIFIGHEYTKPDMSRCDWAFSSYFEEEINHPKYMRIPIYILSDYKLKDFGKPPLNKKINFNGLKKEKIKFCNFIYSQDILARNDFFKKLSKYKKIDAPGRCMTNIPPISHNNARESRLASSWVEDKLEFLKDYKFTIAFENFFKPGWVTEKLTHPMLVNSIPIYFGDNAVSKEFNTKSFINFNDFKNMKDFIEYIIKVDNDDSLYEKILREPWYKNNQLPKDLDMSKIKKRFKEIFG